MSRSIQWQLRTRAVPALLVVAVLVSSLAAQMVWTKTPTLLSGRSGHGLAYDAVRQRVVLFGGRDQYGNPLSETWEWDGANWVERVPEQLPAARMGHAMAYDAAEEKKVSPIAAQSGDEEETGEDKATAAKTD